MGESFRLKSIKGILVVGEKGIFNELAQIVDLALEANTLSTKMFKMSPTDAGLSESLPLMEGLWNRAADAAFKCSEDITGGAVSPNVIDSLLRCTQLVADVVHINLHGGRELVRMAKAYSAGLEMHYAHWDSVFESMLASAEQSLLKLKQALGSSNVAEMMR